MKPMNAPLQRLFKAAAQAPVEAPAEMRLGFDTRVLAVRRPELHEASPWKPLLRGALICSAVIVLLSVAVNYQIFQSDVPDELTLADAVIRTTMNP